VKHNFLDLLLEYERALHLLRVALHQVSAKKSTALYDAIVVSAVRLENNSRLNKKVPLVITDGQDYMSQETLQEASRRLHRRMDRPFMPSD
jgi:Mg-chelatase subunit ChlD